MNTNNRFLTSTGRVIPWCIYGTAWKKERTANLVVKAIEAGFRGVDTACQPRHYNESQVGDALKRVLGKGIRREEIYLQTKYTAIDGQDPKSVPYTVNASVTEQVNQSVEVSLKNLQTSYIDTLILHSPMRDYEQTLEAWRTMESIVASGQVYQLGISNFYDLALVERLYEDVEVKPVVLQNRFYQETGYDKELREFCSNKGMFYESFWTLTANPHVLSSNAIKAIAQKHGKTAPQIFFRFLNQSRVVFLTGTCDEQHMLEDLSILEFELSEQEMVLIRLVLGLE
ncbi:aldo/keto reductase family protein [Desulfosediminicola flagellatus]|uniref:aldo/keto reductase family protein n=1 Tax=Desulfosediminicola flagellatus TaxID=2569541 RepID=UPI0010AC3478|nr:aldo/keto reductase [Desulfosediminicola flagellatus]